MSVIGNAAFTGVTPKWRLIQHGTITQETALLTFSDINCEDIWLFTNGLKTAKTSQMGAFIKIIGSNITISQAILYVDNVFNAISTQVGFLKIQSLVDNLKVISRINPDLSQTKAPAIIAGLPSSGYSPQPIPLGTIQTLAISPSESQYPFTSGEYWLYGR